MQRRLGDDDTCNTLALPLIGGSGAGWPAVLYLVGLGWCFLGVAIIADIFMGAIEKITSQKVRRFSSQTQRMYTAVVWNPTVANLTLMALGSSAPEIMLNVIETCLTNEMYSGDLGPGTIVGSAAFNLFMIIAVCVSAIPDGEIRLIKEVPVYVITASCSIFAYIWLLVVLLVISPHVVEPWEGFLTFLFFPGLVFLAFLADKGYFSENRKKSHLVTADMSKEELAELRATIRRDFGNISDDQMTKIIAVQCGDRSSRAHYRVSATRRLTGGKRVRLQPRMRSTKLLSAFVSKKILPIDEEPEVEEPGCCDENLSVIQFSAGRHAVLENSGSKVIKVLRSGDLSSVATVKYKTRDGSAKAQGRQTVEEGEGDYIHAEGSITFEAGEVEKTIEIKILDDYTYEEDEDFHVDLYEPDVIIDTDSPKMDKRQKAALGLVSTTTIVIIDDDMAGIISWEQEEYRCKEQPQDHEEHFTVLRKHGSKNKVVCKFTTESDSAIAGKDFEQTSGTVAFEEGVVTAVVSVKILARGRYAASECFRIVLTEITEGSGAKFDETTDGGADSCIATVHIITGQQEMERIDKMMSSLSSIWDKAKIGHHSWKDQFIAALYVNGGEDDDSDDSAPSWQDKVMHVLTLPWKVLFAFCPPTDYCGGWVCFCCSLLMIGLVTIIIGDLANLVGCSLSFMENEITAITFVALGTSLPDTFASRTAAEQDPYADASVGNVTGSNSVNVFLGLGLPWMIASTFWWYRGKDEEWDGRYQNDPDLSWLGEVGSRRQAYVLKAGNLAFSVTVFTLCAAMALTVLAIRRRYVGGELGGPRCAKWLTSGILATLWFMYIFMSILKVKGAI
mmetsp:Transcript_68682/g.178388  ORF Transcript_68682/g.178388 Transcript_68682/m.178388 type:complete len:845 (+) Transcript_68682:94-2628(+)